LRYRPTDPVALADHAGKLALLTVDLVDIPPLALELAIQRWAVTKPFLPRAAELAELAKELATAAADRPRPTLAEQCDARNAALAAANNWRVRWIITPDGQWQATDFKDWDRRQREERDGPPPQVTADEVAAILAPQRRAGRGRG
jgi:hypothetical protein